MWRPRLKNALCATGTGISKMYMADASWPREVCKRAFGDESEEHLFLCVYVACRDNGRSLWGWVCGETCWAYICAVRVCESMGLQCTAGNVWDDGVFVFSRGVKTLERTSVFWGTVCQVKACSLMGDVLTSRVGARLHCRLPNLFITNSFQH